jgi:hypothetical protein
VPFSPDATTYRYQVILPAADLITGSLVPGPVYGMRLNVQEPGATVGFLKIRLKNTDQSIAGNQPDDTGLVEVYHRSTDFSGAGIVFPFYQAFDWTGQNLLVDISFTTSDPADVP